MSMPLLIVANVNKPGHGIFRKKPHPKGEIYTGKEDTAEEADSLVPSPSRIYFKIKAPILCGSSLLQGVTFRGIFFFSREF